MKNILLDLRLAAALASGAIYPDAMQVVEIDEQRDLVTLETSTGLLYEFYGVTEERTVGDVAAVLMYNNGTTKTALDDAILRAVNSGFRR